MLDTKEILFIEDRIPYRFIGAGFPRSQEILKSLNRSGNKITFYPTVGDDYPEYFQEFKKNLPNVTFVQGDQYKKNGLSSYLKSEGKKFDAILITRPKNIALFSSLENVSHAGVVYDTEAINAFREAENQRLNGNKVPPDDLLKNISRELEPARNAKAIFAVSRIEKSAVVRVGFNQKQVKVLSHVVHPAITTTTFSNRRDLLFVGVIHGDNTPNADSLLWFINEVFPVIRQSLPDLNLNIAGLCKSEKLAKLKINGVNYIGSYNDLTTQYNHHRVFIVPTRYAAGIPLKVVEAAASGLPTVVTPLIASQLEWKDHQEALVAGDPKIFAEKVIELYRDPLIWKKTQESALDSVTMQFSKEKFESSLAEGMSLAFL